MRRSLITSLLMFLSVIIAYGASPLDGHQIRHYTISDGLASNAVYSFCQDSKGRMWFGTIDGLHSFDGYEITERRDDAIKSLGSVISCIMEDSRQRLWIGSGSGVALYDMRKEKFMELPVDKTSGVRIKSPVLDIITSRDGHIWIATNGEGVFRYDPETTVLSQYPATSKISNDVVRALLEDSSGEIWAGTMSGLCRFLPSQDRFAPLQGSLNEKLHVTSLFEDGSHNIWIGSRGAGLFLFDKKNDTVINKLAPDGSMTSVLIRQIVEWQPGQLCLASDLGLTFYDIAMGATSNVKDYSRASNTINDKYLQTLYVDREGALWVGTYFGGVNYVSPGKSMFRHFHTGNTNLKAKIISVFAQAEGDNLWLGSDDSGVFHWDRAANHFRGVCDHPLLDGSTHRNIHALLQDNDRLFVGMYIGGLNIIDLKTNSVRNHLMGDAPNSLYSSSIYSIYKDSGGDIWLGTSNGLNRYREETDDFERIFEVHPADVCHIIDDRRGFLWACSTDNGVFRMNRQNGRWQHFQAYGEKRSESGNLPPKSIVTAACDEKGEMWFGTDGAGLLRFDYQKGEFIREKLPEWVRVVNKIIPSGKNLWLGTTKGLLCYDTESKTLHVYNKESGLQENVFLPNSGMLTSDGHLVMGGINGFNEFLPDNEEPVFFCPEVILSDFHIFNRPVEIGGEDSPLDESITWAEGLTLKDSQKVISFKVSPVSYANPTRNIYRYMLEGFDKDWSEAQPPFPHTYTNLPAGNYVFKVSMSDGNGGWQEAGLEFPIKVLPPWWLSLPMKALYAIACLLGVWILYRWMTGRQQEKLRDLAAAKDRELYRSKLEFFTHIVHEIRTPLTLVISPLENMLSSKDTIPENRRQLVVMERNARRLLNLVNHLMDFRKVEEGMVRLKPEAVDLRVLLNGICENFFLTATIRHMEVRTEIADEPCFSNVDREAFRQIVDNLLSNALKFSKSEIVIRLVRSDDGRFMLSVKDNGKGIPEEEREKIFIPFYQSSDLKSVDNNGTGLGLLLVKRYADLMGATVELVSKYGEGAEFRIYFKACAQEPAVDAVPVPVSEDAGEEMIPEVAEDIVLEASAEDETEDMHRSLLVVDDNPDMLNFLSQLLSVKYDVTTASSADEALELLNDIHPVMIVSDVMMPGTDGMEFCRIVKQNIQTSHIPVVLLTAKVDSGDFVEGFESGADSYVTKPFSPDVFMARIDSIIANRERMKKRLRDNPSLIPDVVPDNSLDKEFFRKIGEVVEERLSDPEFTIEALASEVAISRTGLFTKLKAIAGITPNEYIRQIRLRKAAELLSDKRYRVSEVCWQVGFSSRSHFAKCFQSQYGVLPSEYHKKAVSGYA